MGAGGTKNPPLEGDAQKRVDWMTRHELESEVARLRQMVAARDRVIADQARALEGLRREREALLDTVRTLEAGHDRA